jgi:N-acetylneuraminic acid mutarotase
MKKCFVVSRRAFAIATVSKPRQLFLALLLLVLAGACLLASTRHRGFKQMFGGGHHSLLAGTDAYTQPIADSAGTFTVINATGAGTGAYQGTAALVINEAGEIAGLYEDSSGIAHAFVRAASGAITPFSAPSLGGVAVKWTIPISINTAGDVAGTYIDDNVVTHGFVRTAGGTFTSFDAPGAGTAANRGTVAFSINDAGEIVGFFSTGSSTTSSTYHGFLRAVNGTITNIDAPDAGSGEDPDTGQKWGTQAFAINAAGEIAGSYVDTSSDRHGFLRLANGTFDEFEAPGASTTGKKGCFNGTDPGGIDAVGDVVGSYRDANGLCHGFIRAANDTYTSFEPPAAAAGGGLFLGTEPFSIDPAGEHVAGLYSDASGVYHGFVRAADGTYTIVDAPAAGAAGSSMFPGTGAVGVNESGEVAGTYMDANGTLHGFLFKPTAETAVATPTFSLAAGVYTVAQKVSISDKTTGAAIYYTTNGTTPTASSTKYSTPITVSATTTIKAIAVEAGYTNSAVATATYTIHPIAATPVFKPIAGNYGLAQSVTLTDATTGAAIHYTTNGATPTASSPKYSAAIHVSAASTTIKAIATATGYTNSPVATAVYKIGLAAAATPKFSEGTGTYSSIQTVTLSDATAGAAIYYTTDGVLPTTASTKYVAAIRVGATETIRAIAASATHSNSAVASATFTIHLPPAAKPVLHPAGGNYSTAQSVTMTDATPGAAIYYTTNKAAPTASSTRYTTAVKVSKTTTIEAVAIASGYSDSAVASATYTFPTTANAKEWAWMRGSNTANKAGVYGTLGTAAAANTPGARSGAASWTDLSGNLWLFGGGGYDASGASGQLNDLWKFNPSTKEWTWMSGSSTVGSSGGKSGVYGALGVAAAGNVPGGRSLGVSWTDLSGNLWLFGGQGYDAAGRDIFLNDLWEFNPQTKEWAWMGGTSTPSCALPSPDYCGASGEYGALGTPAAGNVPGGRYSATSATDSSGHFWLFGGYGYADAGACCYLNDLWEFNPSTKEWTWISGGSGGEQRGVYGVLETASAGNVPGSRYYADSWIDSSGHFWVLGGYGFDASSTGGYLDDLWEFNPSTKDWTWMAGGSAATCWASELCPQTGVYGALGVAAKGNLPGNRSGASSWKDGAGNLWLFGSLIWHSNGSGGYVYNYLNDLWEFKPSTNEWTWMGGSGTPNQPGVYGASGAPAEDNIPGSRYFATSWTDLSGNLWLFGGSGYDSKGTLGSLNDLWEYQP